MAFSSSASEAGISLGAAGRLYRTGAREIAPAGRGSACGGGASVEGCSDSAVVGGGGGTEVESGVEVVVTGGGAKDKFGGGAN